MVRLQGYRKLHGKVIIVMLQIYKYNAPNAMVANNRIAAAEKSSSQHVS